MSHGNSIAKCSKAEGNRGLVKAMLSMVLKSDALPLQILTLSVRGGSNLYNTHAYKQGFFA